MKLTLEINSVKHATVKCIQLACLSYGMWGYTGEVLPTNACASEVKGHYSF